MKTWAAILHATNSCDGTALHVIFVKAMTIMEAHTTAIKACRDVFPESGGYKEQIAIVRNTQIMYDELAFVDHGRLSETSD